MNTKDKSWLLNELYKFLEIKSISCLKNTYEEIKNASLYLINLFKSINLEAEILTYQESNPVVFAEYKTTSSDKILLFYNHYDVMPAEEENWKTEPFSPKLIKDKIYARGAADNKGNLLARIAAVAELIKTNSLNINVKFLVEGEEEIGSPNLAKIVEKYKDKLHADLCIWEDGAKDELGRIEIYLGCKGILYIELAAYRNGAVLHSSYGAIVKNPAWRLIQALSTLKDNKDKIKIPGFYDDVMTISEEELELLKHLPFDEEIKLKRLNLPNFINNLSGIELKKKFIYEPVININGIYTGYIQEGHKTIIPDVATAKLDIRLVPQQQPKDILKKLMLYLEKLGFGEDIKIIHADGYPAAKSNLNHPYVKLALNTIKEVYNKEYVVYPLLPASGPMYLFSKNMPCIGVGISNAESNPHSSNEFIYLEDLLLGIEYFKRLMINF